MTVEAVFDLVEIDTTEGTFRFLPGQDGDFTDINGHVWIGSSMISIGDVNTSIDGIAPSVQLTFSYFQDPNDPDLIDQMKALGLSYVKGREVRFYYQEMQRISEMWSPASAPILFTTRFSSGLSYNFDGVSNRSITLTANSFADQRNNSRRIILNTEGHKRILGGVANPSLTFMPENDFQEDKLFE